MSILAACTLLSSCGVLCQAGTGTCGLSSEEAHRLLHPKAYGQYWTKPSMTTESWRQDWVACGGQANGQYFSDESTVPTVAAALTADKNKRAKLDTCMQSKGYQFSYTGTGGTK